MQLKVQTISKHYGDLIAVDNLSFEVKSGEMFALLGPNGAGKSSTIRMLIGLTYPDKGQLEFVDQQGQQHSSLSSDTFGYLPEERGLYQESNLLDTLIYMGQLKGMSKSQAAIQAEQWLDSFDLLTRKKDPLKSLSKGNQQKVQLISAIIHQPKIVFLDEPFSGLDPVNQEKVMRFFEQLKQQGTTIIFSAHQMSLVEKLADRFLLMDKGKAVLYGNLQEIRDNAQLGSKLTVTFSQALPSQQFTLSEQILAVKNIDSHILQFTLAPQCHVPQFLQTLLSEYQIESLQSTQPSLHDIYLNSIQGAA
ncbi:ABC transporter ATP-binding protein [Paraglaciecola aestuariivivens]